MLDLRVSTALSACEHQALAELKAELLSRFEGGIAGCYLYGSKARGEAGPDSDLDVLVVVHPELRRAVADAAADIVSRLLLRGMPFISVVVKDINYWTWETPFRRNVERDAVTL